MTITYCTGTVLDEETQCSLADLCRLCSVNAEHIHEMIDEGLLSPRGHSSTHWRFSALEVKRVQVTMRLRRDLRINLPGCALVLDLLEELEELRQKKRFE